MISNPVAVGLVAFVVAKGGGREDLASLVGAVRSHVVPIDAMETWDQLQYAWDATHPPTGAGLPPELSGTVRLDQG